MDLTSSDLILRRVKLKTQIQTLRQAKTEKLSTDQTIAHDYTVFISSISHGVENTTRPSMCFTATAKTLQRQCNSFP